MKKALFSTVFILLNFFGVCAIVPPTVSTSTNQVYFNIKVTQSGKYITDAGLNTKLTQIATLTAGSASQLWKVVETAPGTGQYIIVSKLGHAFYWVAADERHYAGTSTIDLFTFETPFTGNYYAVHRLGGQYVNCWAGDVKGASGNTQIGQYSVPSDDFNKLEFISAETATVDAIAGEIEICELVYTYVLANSGSSYGQLSTSAVNNFRSAIDAAKMVRDGSGTQQEKDQAASTLATARTAMVNSPKTMPVPSTSSTHTYYNIKVLQSSKYITDAGLDSKLTQQVTLVSDNPAQMWRLEENSSSLGSYYLISKSGRRMKWSATDERYLASSTGDSFTFGYPSLGICVLHRASGNYLNCWAGDVKGEPGNTQIGEYVAFIDAFNNLDFVSPKTLFTQTISFPDIPSKTINAASFNLGASTTATGLPITYESSNQDIATVSSSGDVTITATAEGYTDITASQSGNNSYDAATPITKRLYVSRATTALNWGNSIISIGVADRKIIVTGTSTPLKVYSLSGSVIDPIKTLSPGIYIVKVGSKVCKVNVE